MGDQKRRTEIQIETHEITIIRFGKLQRMDPVETTVVEAEVVAHTEPDPLPTTQTEALEKE